MKFCGTKELISSINCCCSVAKLCPTLVTLWTVACRALLSMGFPRQECWSRLPFPPPGDLPDPVIEPASPALAGRFFTSEPLLLLLLSRFSHVWLCATPETSAHQAPPSLGFSRQEHWGGLPFPSPFEPLEKSKIYAMTKKEKEGIVTDLKRLKRPITTVWITNRLWKILKELRIPDHLICLLRNLYAGQEARVRTRHGTMDWFKTGNEYVKAVYCHPTYLTSIQSTSCEMPGWNQDCQEKYQ